MLLSINAEFVGTEYHCDVADAAGRVTASGVARKDRGDAVGGGIRAERGRAGDRVGLRLRGRVHQPAEMARQHGLRRAVGADASRQVRRGSRLVEAVIRRSPPLAGPRTPSRGSPAWSTHRCRAPSNYTASDPAQSLRSRSFHRGCCRCRRRRRRSWSRCEPKVPTPTAAMSRAPHRRSSARRSSATWRCCLSP